MMARLLCALLGHRKPVRMAHAGFGGYYEDLECPRCRCSVDTALGFPCRECKRAAFFVHTRPKAGKRVDVLDGFFAAHLTEELPALFALNCQWCKWPFYDFNAANVRTFWTHNGEAVRPARSAGQ